jgi:hypothetical protein
VGQSEKAPPSSSEAPDKRFLPVGERWMRERWPRFGFYFGLVLIGWLLLGVVPWWTVPLMLVVDAVWSARRGDWSLVAFLAWGAVSVAGAVGLVSLLL